MEVYIRNIGKIKEAHINLKDLLVIAGVNSTGKTTVAKSLAALLSPLDDLTNYTNDLRKQSIDKHIFDLVSNISRQLTFSLFFEDKKPADLLYDYLLRNSKAEVDKDVLEKLFIGKKSDKVDLKDVTELANQINKILHRKDSNYYNRIIDYSFYSFFKNQIVSFGAQKGLIDVSGLITYENDNKKTTVHIKSLNNQSLGQVVYIPSNYSFDGWPRVKEQIIGFTLSAGIELKSITDQLRKPIIQSNSDIAFEDYEESIRQIQSFKDVIEQIVNGYIDVNSEKESFFVDRNKENIHLCNLATGILPFSTIERLIENGTLKRNSLLIIDEPESHLHPQWQVQFGKLLCSISQRLGVKVVVLSHSPYLIRSIDKEVSSGSVNIDSSFYLMSNNDEGFSFIEDVTDNTERIYYQLYKPLEEI